MTRPATTQVPPPLSRSAEESQAMEIKYDWIWDEALQQQSYNDAMVDIQ